MQDSMAPTKTISCRFYQQGFCRNGQACDFVHERDASTQNHFKSVASPCSAVENLTINVPDAVHPCGQIRSTQPCKFFMRGSCNKSDKCGFTHSLTVMPPQQVLDVTSSESSPGQQAESSPEAPVDSRARVACKYFSLPNGCQNGSCPYLHVQTGNEVESNQVLELTEDEDQECEDDSTRDLSGALVYFNEFGHAVKISLPTDFSIACITGLEPRTTPSDIVTILRSSGYNISIDCVRIHEQTMSSELKATVRVEDHLFARNLIASLKDQRSTFTATSVPIDARRTNCRKIFVSWHKATQSVWMNFGNGDIANRVAQKFNAGKYKCLGQSVKASSGKRSSSRAGRGGYSHNPVAWTVTLSSVPGHAIKKDIEDAITLTYDRPRHVEMGQTSYQASDAEVSIEVRSHLEKHGPLESFFLAPNPKGKRAKATAWFQDESDARAACSLNNRSLGVLGNGKLTVTLIQSAKCKVRTTVYFALKSKIEQECETWRERHLMVTCYTDSSRRFTIFKIQGENVKDVAVARKTLEEISKGVVLTHNGNVVWSPVLRNNGSTYMKLKSIEKELHVVIDRVKPKRQLLFYGPPEAFQQAVRRVSDMLGEESSTSYEIDLRSHNHSWTSQGGFKTITQALGKNIAVFDEDLSKLTVYGTQEEYNMVLALMDGERAFETRPVSIGPSTPEADCPICFCEAENPTQTSCKHTYCLDCYEECCKSAATTSKNEFQIKCQGDGGDCSTRFTLSELKGHLSSSVFETVLKSSFEEYIKRHPEVFRYCPTPDCDHIYRCTSASDSELSAHSCPNCFEPICTCCHARHGDYTCAEYKDIASGGYEALRKLKKELNIKDCPKCTTPMEKTEGCNHMTCGGCKAHICWVCMAVFETSGPCYAHMNKEHGGNGLGPQNW